MSYLEKLIERATDTNLDLENNQIGNYRITPQHGVNLAQYFIYKNNCKPYYSKSTRRYNNVHVASVCIYDRKVDIEVNSSYLIPKEISEIIDTINNIYSEFDINTKNF